METLPFELALGTRVRISISGEEGIVIGRGQFANADNQYLVRYKAADGRAVEQWWVVDALEEIE